jgi:hypothetical protein
MAVVDMFARLVDPAFFPSKMTFGDKMYRLAILSPQDARDIEYIVDMKLKKHWPPPKRPKDAA